MIGFEKVAAVYAEALLAASIDAGAVSDLEEDFGELTRIFRGDTNVWAFFKSPIIDIDQKIDLLTRSLKDKVGDTFFAFLCVLCKRRRFELLPDVSDALKGLMDQHMKRKRVQIFTAVPLSDDHRAELQSALRSKFKMEVVLEVIEKPDLIGGLVVRAGDLKEDSSVKDSLARISKSLAGKRILGEKYYA